MISVNPDCWLHSLDSPRPNAKFHKRQRVKKKQQPNEHSCMCVCVCACVTTTTPMRANVLRVHAKYTLTHHIQCWWISCEQRCQWIASARLTNFYFFPKIKQNLLTAHTATENKRAVNSIQREKKKTKWKKCLRLDHTHARALANRDRHKRAKGIYTDRSRPPPPPLSQRSPKVTKIFNTYTRAEPCVCDNRRKPNVFHRRSGSFVRVRNTNANHKFNIPSDTESVCVCVFLCAYFLFVVPNPDSALRWKFQNFLHQSFFPTFFLANPKIYQTNALSDKHRQPNLLSAKNTLRANGV